jgi:hypothetical protein
MTPPPQRVLPRPRRREPAELPLDELLATWVEDAGNYLRLDLVDLIPREEPQPDPV